jgi:hypothetical protein
MNEAIDLAVQSLVVKSTVASNNLAQYGRYFTAAIGVTIATAGIAFLKYREQRKIEFFR